MTNSKQTSSKIGLEIRLDNGEELTTFHNKDNVNLFVGLSSTDFMSIALTSKNVEKLRDSLSKWLKELK